MHGNTRARHRSLLKAKCHLSKVSQRCPIQAVRGGHGGKDLLNVASVVRAVASLCGDVKGGGSELGLI